MKLNLKLRFFVDNEAAHQVCEHGVSVRAKFV